MTSGDVSEALFPEPLWAVNVGKTQIAADTYAAADRLRFELSLFQICAQRGVTVGIWRKGSTAFRHMRREARFRQRNSVGAVNA